MTIPRRFLLAVLPLLALFLISDVAHAHGLHMFAAREDGRITGYVYAHADEGIPGMTVTARTTDDEVLGTAITDEGGAFSLDIDTEEEIRITAVADDGHHAHATVPALGDDHAHAHDHAPAPEQEHAADDAHTQNHSHAMELDDMGDVVAQRLLPLEQRIDSLEAKIGLRDILGGIGYILGLAGIAAFLMRRK
jgi:nickel transport protein